MSAELAGGQVGGAEPPPELTALYQRDQGAVVAPPELEAPRRPGAYEMAVEVDGALKDAVDLQVITRRALLPRGREGKTRDARSPTAAQEPSAVPIPIRSCRSASRR